MPACSDDLRNGLTLPDTSGRPILYRYLLPEDDVHVITAFLHEAYAPLAGQGMRFLASHQDAEVTRQRMSKGQTILAADAGLIVGIVTLADAAATRGTPFYDRPDVTSFGQFAVRPSHQRRGIGSMLMSFVERLAAEHGAAEIALDTSENAAHLMALYRSRGYRYVEHCQWTEVNYRSVVLAKRVGS